MGKEKRQLLLSVTMLVLFILLLVGTTIAYFSDSRQIKNTMTVGNVEIELTEAAVRRDSTGQLVVDPAAPRVVGGDNAVQNYGYIYPGTVIQKDPTIRNVGSEDAWIAARIVVTDGQGDLHKVMGYDTAPGIDIRMLLGGGLLDEGAHVGRWNGIDNVRYNDDYAMVQKADAVMGQYVFYLFLQNPFVSDDKVVLFDRLAVPPEWSSEQMQELKELNICVEAYGVQTFDLTSCYDAMTKAFPEQFSF